MAVVLERSEIDLAMREVARRYAEGTPARRRAGTSRLLETVRRWLGLP